MNNLIVFCRVAPRVRPTLTKSCSPASLITAAERNTFPKFCSANYSWLTVWASVIFYWWRTTAIPYWLDYVTKSEVDITVLFIHWLDCVPQVPPFATRQTSALPWSEADITALSTITAPDQVCFYLARGVSLDCIKAINYFCEHYTLQTVLIHTLVICLSIGLYSLSTIHSILTIDPT